MRRYHPNYTPTALSPCVFSYETTRFRDKQRLAQPCLPFPTRELFADSALGKANDFVRRSAKDKPIARRTCSCQAHWWTHSEPPPTDSYPEHSQKRGWEYKHPGHSSGRAACWGSRGYHSEASSPRHEPSTLETPALGQSRH